MAFEGFTQASRDFIQQRGQASSGIEKFLKLEGAFKDAVRQHQIKSRITAKENLGFLKTKQDFESGQQTEALDAAQKRADTSAAATTEAAGIRAGASGGVGAFKIKNDIISQARQLAGDEFGGGAFREFSEEERERFRDRIGALIQASAKENGVNFSLDFIRSIVKDIEADLDEEEGGGGNSNLDKTKSEIEDLSDPNAFN
jgi:hypothetical protein